MEETAIKSTEQLINQGVLGIFCVLLIVALVFTVRYVLSQHRQQMGLTVKLTEMANDFRKSEDRNTDAIEKLTQVIHDKL